MPHGGRKNKLLQRQSGTEFQAIICCHLALPNTSPSENSTDKRSLVGIIN